MKIEDLNIDDIRLLVEMNKEYFEKIKDYSEPNYIHYNFCKQLIELKESDDLEKVINEYKQIRKSLTKTSNGFISESRLENLVKSKKRNFNSPYDIKVRINYLPTFPKYVSKTESKRHLNVGYNEVIYVISAALFNPLDHKDGMLVEATRNRNVRMVFGKGITTEISKYFDEDPIDIIKYYFQKHFSPHVKEVTKSFNSGKYENAAIYLTKTIDDMLSDLKKAIYLKNG